jgi:penicillin-binding protein 1B
LGTAFGIYLWTLYGQLTTAFLQQEQFLPTRIYSDVTRISAPQLRFQIENKLKTLGYIYTQTENTIQFTPHPIEYPMYLIPTNHPLVDRKDQPVTLHFDQTGSNATLQSLTLGNLEVTDIYLEPELVATLSRSGEAKREIRTYLKFDEVPALLWKAIIAIEDQHFLEHKGLDPRGIARAFWINLKTLSLAQGGSTLTQQLVKNLMARRTKNIFRKANELFLALLLEAKMDKEKILERYLNEVYLGQVGNLEVHGVAEGAEHFFGKKVENLNLAEIALVAGLIRGPGFYSPYRYKERALERQRLVLRKMVETGQIAEDEAKAALHLPIRLSPPQNSANKAPFFTDYVKAELIRQLKDRMTEAEVIQAGFRVYTTLDSTLNTEAQKAVSDGIIQLETRIPLEAGERLEGALATVDHKTGYIRALVGGRSYSQSNFNRILNMKRQVGSTFKPIVYLAAFQKGEDPNGVPYGPGHPVDDSPWTLVFDRGKQTWSPRNYEKENRGWVSLRTALTHSINTAAARLGFEIGIDQIITTGRSLGIESDLPPVPSLSLGVAELSPIELLKVYATVANRGTQDELTVIRGITQPDGTNYARFVYHPKQVSDPAPMDLLTDVLQGVFNEGTARGARKMGFDRPAAGKTGTTSNYRDAWFAGYTPQLTTVVWVGMDQHSFKKNSHLGLTGANSALPIWVSFMKKALLGEALMSFPQSPLIEEIQIDSHSGKVATSDCPASQVVLEKYIQGRGPKDKACETLWPTSTPKTVKE